MRKIIFIILLYPMVVFSQQIINIDNDSIWIGTTRNIVFDLDKDYGKDANLYGFLPTATAAENADAWNSIPAGGTVRIYTPGVYEIDTTLFLKSNTKYWFCAGSTIKKTGDEEDYCHVFINENAPSNLPDSNIYFYGNGLRIWVNSIDDYTIALASRMRAQFQLFKTKNFIVDDYYIDDGGINQYLMCIASCQDGLISNVNFTGSKDGLKIVASHDITINDITTSTLDDALSIVAIDYNSTTPLIGDCYNITIDGWTELPFTGAYGRSLLFLHDSWGQWTSGETYKYFEPVINNGRIYRKADDAAEAASVAPTHTSGTVTGADGLSWTYWQDGTFTSVNVTNVIVKNATSTASRLFAAFGIDNYFLNKDELAIFDDITFDNITFTPTIRNASFISYWDKVGDVIIKNSNLVPAIDETYTDYLVIGGVTANAKKSSFSHLLIDSCYIDVKLGDGILLSSTNDANCTFRKITVQNSTIIDTTNNAALLYINRADQLDTAIFTNVYFYKASNILNMRRANIVSYLEANNCTFLNPAYLIYSSIDVTSVHAKMTGCIYSEPISYLFRNNFATSTLDINLSKSSGSVTQSKVRNGENVTVTACDLPYN